MARVHLFNPENDLALAFGGDNYTAPPNAVALHRAGEMLPMWYACDGDYIIAPNCDELWLERISRLFDINVELYHDTLSANINEACPWGWSRDVRRQFLKAGVPDNILPDDDTLNRHRQLSHRHTSLIAAQQLQQRLPFPTPPLPIEAISPEEVLNYRKEHGGCYVKSPWSSSGRGVFDASSISDDELTRRVAGIIRRQGSVMCEAALDKIEDFAMLFYSNGEDIRFIGYSLFYTEHAGAYSGNIVAPDDYIKRHLSTMVSLAQLDIVTASLTDILTSLIAPHYKGYMGVDMLIYRDHNGNNLIAPCIEVNLRMTMGIMARCLGDKILASGSQGKMKIEFKGSNVSATAPIIDEHKLVSGTLSLIPPGSDFNITLEATVI